jgi:hypothetical protein
MESATIKCPTCGGEFPAGARFCPHCGYVVPPTLTHVEEPAPAPQILVVQQRASAPGWVPWVAGLGLAIVVGTGIALASLGYFSPPSVNPSIAVVPTPDSGNPPVASAPDINITMENPPAGEAPATAQQPDINITVPPAPPATTPPPATNPPAEQGKLAVLSVSAAPKQQGSSSWRYGYEFKLQNLTATDAVVKVRVRFLDAAGNELDNDLVTDITIPHQAEKSFAGAKDIPAAVAAQIRSVRADFEF